MQKHSVELEYEVITHDDESVTITVKYQGDFVDKITLSERELKDLEYVMPNMYQKIMDGK